MFHLAITMPRMSIPKEALFHCRFGSGLDSTLEFALADGEYETNETAANRLQQFEFEKFKHQQK